MRRTRIPMLGLAKLFVQPGDPSGVRLFDIAIFEDVRMSRDSVRNLDKAVRETTRERWIPMVRVRERGEWTAVFARPYVLDTSKLAATLDEHPRYARDFARGKGE
ncbi:MAG: hypothetical protein ACM3ZB_11385 [bacterium]